MASRLDGPEERKKDLDKRYDKEGGGKNPFRPKLPAAKNKKAAPKKVASRVFGDKNSRGS